MTIYRVHYSSDAPATRGGIDVAMAPCGVRVGWEGTAASSLVSAVTCARCIRNRVPRSDKGA